MRRIGIAAFRFLFDQVYRDPRPVLRRQVTECCGTDTPESLSETSQKYLIVIMEGLTSLSRYAIADW